MLSMQQVPGTGSGSVACCGKPALQKLQHARPEEEELDAGVLSGCPTTQYDYLGRRIVSAFGAASRGRLYDVVTSTELRSCMVATPEIGDGLKMGSEIGGAPPGDVA